MKKIFLLIAIIGLSINLTMAQISKKQLAKDAKFFTDNTYSAIKSGTKTSDLESISTPELKKAAQDMAAGKYDSQYRVAEYRAYPSPRALARAIKLGEGFSRYENMTGMYLDAGENVIFVGDTHGKEISLLAPFWMRKPAPKVKDATKDPEGWGLMAESFKLTPGINIINLKRAANVYLSYYDDNAESAPAIKVHFLTGRVNGYFDTNRGDTNEQWNALLKNAVSPVMDARGKYIQVAYPVEWFNFYTQNKGVELMEAYDKMLLSQYEFMGLAKYNKIPTNRILARVNFNYYMFRDQDGVAYLGDKSTMNKVANPAVVVSGDPCWGFSHEVGHVLQMQPQMTWGGMTEVSNNLFSMHTSARMGNPSRLKAQDNYAKAREAILGKGVSFLQNNDPFNRLVPFWQLQLYFAGQKGYADFYGDVMEAMRNRPTPSEGKGKNLSILNQFDFMKVVCDVTKTDLTDFFDKWGFFYVGDISLNDYGQYNYKITPEQIAEVKEYIASKNYPKPDQDLTLIGE